jgi:hypothetical protein
VNIYLAILKEKLYINFYKQMKLDFLMEVLSNRLVEVEEMAKHFIIYKGLNQINVPETQREIFGEYEANPILNDALLGRQTVAESLEELAQVNKGAKRFFPHKKNKVHNERVKQMSELVPDVENLRTKGIFYPDNLVAGIGIGLTACATGLGLSFLLTQYYSPKILVASSIIIIPATICAGAFYNREKQLPRNEARYLDGKVSQFYGTPLN